MKFNYIFYLISIIVAFAYFVNCSYVVKSHGINYLFLTKNMPYLYYGLSPDAKCVSFKVRTRGEFYLTLSKSRWDDGDFSLDFRLGTNGGLKSSIVRTDYCKKVDTIVEHTPYIFADDCFHSFWLSWHDGIFTLGKKGSRVALLKWCQNDPYTINYFGIRAVNSDTEFMFEEDCCPATTTTLITERSCCVNRHSCTEIQPRCHENRDVCNHKHCTSSTSDVSRDLCIRSQCAFDINRDNCIRRQCAPDVTRRSCC